MIQGMPRGLYVVHYTDKFSVDKSISSKRKKLVEEEAYQVEAVDDLQGLSN